MVFRFLTPMFSRRSIVCAGLAGALAVAAHPTGAQTRQVPTESLIYDLDNPDPVRRREAAVLIGQNKVQRATPDLVATAADPDVSVRRAVVVALQQVDDPRAIPGFVTMSADAERDIREKAIEGMTNAYLPQESGLGVTINKVATFFNPWSDEWAHVVIEPDLAPSPAVVGALEARLSDPEPSLRAKAARSLGILRGRSAIPALVGAVAEERSNDVRFEAARALGKIGDPAVGADLLKLVNYTDAKVRNEVVYTLGRLRYAPAVPDLTRLYIRESAVAPRRMDRTFRERLLGALAFIGDPASKDLFRREARADDPTLVLHAYEGLARIADPATLNEISEARIKEKEPRILTAQAWALYRLGRKEFLTGVVDALATRAANGEARQYLLELSGDQLPDLFPYARHTDTNVREALAEILGLVGDQRAVPTLRELSRDQKGQVAALAAQALHRVEARSRS
jgi:HEAT repeat protein